MLLPDLPIKRYVVVGSYALGTRFAKDIDVVCYYDDILVDCYKSKFITSFIHNGKRIECLLADHQESLQYVLEYYDNDKTIASKTILYAIKAGHITYPHRKWDQHIADYHALRNILKSNTTLDSYTVEYLTKLHKASTAQHHGKQRLPKLKGTSKEDFFDDSVTKYIDHDIIHQWMAHKEKPMYSYMQKDDTVECHEDLWKSFSQLEKVQCVLEECYVIASERHIIPAAKQNKLPPNAFEVFKHALMRVCTTLCSGWFRQFAIDNYYDILNSYDHNYVKRIKFEEIGDISL